MGLINVGVEFGFITVSVIELEFFSSLESGFTGALHFQSTMEPVPL